MPKGSEQLTKARKDEIISACARLYDVLPFKAVTLRKIGENTTFSRTSVYNYFKTREEIFLALLQREYEEWTADILALAAQARTDADGFAEKFSALTARRSRMFKLLSLNIYDMEAGSREENLTQFKRAYKNAMLALRSCLSAHFPHLGERGEKRFVYALYPFLFGVYPYTHATEKQRRAMDAAGMQVPQFDEYELTRSFTAALLHGLLRGE